MTATGRRPLGVLVSGMIATDTHTVGRALAALGVDLLPQDADLDELVRRVLDAAGGTWESAPDFAPSDLVRLARSLVDEARDRMRRSIPQGDSSGRLVWAWADPRHCLVAPFWGDGLDLDIALIHVHRDAPSSVAALADESGQSTDAALSRWERYNRGALAACSRWPSLVVGSESLRTEPEQTARTLAKFVGQLAPGAEWDVPSAVASLRGAPSEPSRPTGSQDPLPTSYQVFDQILSDLEGTVVRTPDDSGEGTSPAFARLRDLYDAEYYHDGLGGLPYSRSEPHWTRFFEEIAQRIVETIHPEKVLDAGCAIGLLVEALRRRDVDAYGIDVSEWAVGQVPDDLRPYCSIGSVTEPIEGYYDLITCIEVLEHLPAFDAQRVIANLCGHADAVLFSSTPDDFDEPTHLNVETPSYWADLFAAQGFFRDFDHDASYLAPQAILFRRSTPDVRALVKGYERVQWTAQETHRDDFRTLEEGWKSAARRVVTLESLLVDRPPAADERTVSALEALIETDALRSLVSGPPVTGTPDDPGLFQAEDYRIWLGARATSPAPSTGPLLSVIVPVFDPVAEHLNACIRSVRAQTYENWELVLVNVSQAPYVEPICRRFSQLDSRVRIIHHENGGIALNTDVGVQASSGAWVVFLDHDDTVEPHALASVVRYIEEHPDADLIYSDEDKLDEDGRFVSPLFKPDYSPDLLRNVNYICHLLSIRRDLYDKSGGLRAGFDGAQDYDLILRTAADARHVGHIADILYHWRQHPGSTAADVRFKPEAHSAGRRALEHFARRHLAGSWLEPAADRSTHRVRYPLRYEKVSIIIPFRDQPELTDVCLRSLAASAPVLPIDVLLVSNRSTEEKTFEAMEGWQEEFSWTTVLEYDEPFNFQRLNNWAAARADGTLLLLLNNDVEALHTGWMEALAEHAQRPEIGAVGARLFYPDGLVQHAGVAVGIGGLADHPWAGLHPDAWTPAGPSYWVRNVSAVTAACLMVEHEKFDRIGGFDERFEVCGGDVDLCLRLMEHGYWNVMTPFARLVHHESATRELLPPDNDVRESLRAYARVLDTGDPFFNANLSRADRSCRVATSALQGNRPGSRP